MQIKKIMLLCLGIIISAAIYSQNDTVPKSKIDPIIKYFCKDKEEIKHLWKFDAVEWGKSNPNIAFEKKLSNKFSLESGWIIYNIKFNSRYKYNTRLNNEFYLECKHFYNYNSRLQKGRTNNGFSGNYLSIGFNSFLPYFYWGDEPEANRLQYKDDYIMPDPNAKFDLVLNGRSGGLIFYEMNINHGIQRRIGRIGYMNIKTGCGAGKGENHKLLYIHPRIKISIGLGFK